MDAIDASDAMLPPQATGKPRWRRRWALHRPIVPDFEQVRVLELTPGALSGTGI